MPDEATPQDWEREKQHYDERREEIRRYFKSQGMVEPEERRGGPDLDEVVELLFHRIRPPGMSWAELATWKNSELQSRREHLERLAEKYPDDAPDIYEELSMVHKDYSHSAIADHVNKLRGSLLIARPPDMQEQFG